MSVTCSRSVVFSGFFHQWNWPLRYNWNIVESDVKHHNPNNNVYFHTYIWIRNHTTFTSADLLCCAMQKVFLLASTVKSSIDYILYIIGGAKLSRWSRKCYITSRYEIFQKNYPPRVIKDAQCVVTTPPEVQAVHG